MLFFILFPLFFAGLFVIIYFYYRLFSIFFMGLFWLLFFAELIVLYFSYNGYY